MVARVAPGRYVVWSNTTDAPSSSILTREQALRLLREREAMEDADALIARVDEAGTSEPGVSVDDLLASNRAGPGERRLTLQELLAEYE